MDNLRVILWVGLGMMLMLSYQAWQGQFAPAEPQPDTVVQPAPQPEQAATGQGDEVPMLEDTAPQRAADLPTMPGKAPAEPEGNFVRVRTDVLDLKINTRGGDLQSATLARYPVHKDQPDVPMQLLSPDPDSLFVFRTGLLEADEKPVPNHQSEYRAAAERFTLAPDADELSVTLTWSSPAGLEVEKTYTFHRGRYDIALDYTVHNNTGEPYRLASYLQLKRVHHPLKRSMFNIDSYSYQGPVVYDGEKYQKLKVDDLREEPYRRSVPGGWLASIQHHFLAAAIPPALEDFRYTADFDGHAYRVSAVGPLATVQPQGSGSFSARLFVGPKLQAQLAEIAESLPLTVDYGRLTILAQPLFWILQKVFNIVGNWGWTIIIVTMMIKLVFYKLTETSGRSMAKMRKLQPRLKALQERFKDDRQALSQAMMELYKREKVNPAAGCLPMLIQIPFFIAFYWVLLESVEMRQAPFMLWINDLSTRDPYFILPVIMGAAMFFQQKLNPTPPDPVQAKIMSVLPIVFTAMFAFFPAGLVLYWVTNSLLTILQQWRINKVIGSD